MSLPVEQPRSPDAINFSLVQALRGLAALWVVLFHLGKRETVSGLTAHLPSWLSYSVFGYGSAGVAVFFVLSGFVISHSLSGKEMTPSAFGRFAVRRSVRLDPPYWGSMVLMVAVGAALSAAHHEPITYPFGTQLAAHLTYTQELLRIPELQIVYWTLTYEIQFYLVYAATRMIRADWALYGLALFSAFMGREWAPHGLFLNLWQGFMLGVLAYRSGYEKRPAWPLILLASVTILFQKSGVFATPCAATAILLFAAARAGRLNALSARPWQWLGSISYSLYLVHLPMLLLLTGVWQRLAGRGFGADTGAAIVLVFACLVASTVFYLTVEYPSHKLAKRLRPIKNSVSCIIPVEQGTSETLLPTRR